MKAERRHHRERLIAKRRHYVVAFEDPTPTRLGKLARTACLCSCEIEAIRVARSMPNAR